MSENRLARSQQVRRVRVDVQRARHAQETQPWAASQQIVHDVPAGTTQRFFPANEQPLQHDQQQQQQSDNSAAHSSVVRAVPASNLIRETMAPPTIDAWPRKQNKLSSLSQKPSDAENIPPLMKQLNKLVWEGLRTTGLLVDRVLGEYTRDPSVHDIDALIEEISAKNKSSATGAFSQVTSSRLLMEVVHRFMDSVLEADELSARDPTELARNRSDLAEDTRRAHKVVRELCGAVARWSIFEQAGAVFSKCFATYETAISEVMKECADCVDDVLSVLVTEIVALRGRLASARAEIRTHSHSMDKVCKERDAIHARLLETDATAQEALARIAQRDKENKRLGFELEDRDKTIQRQADEMELMSKQFSVQESRITKLSTQLAQAKEQIDSLTMKVADLKRSLAQSESVATTCAVETLHLRQQLASVQIAHQQVKSELMNEASSASGKSRRMSTATAAHSTAATSKHNHAASTGTASSSSSSPPQIIVLDINDFREAAARAYVAEVEARYSFYDAQPGDPLDPTGAFSHWRSALTQGLDNMAQNPSLAAVSTGMQSSTIMAVHFPDIKPRNTTALQVMQIADDGARPFFVGMGDAAHVPAALRYVGKIPNMRFSADTVSKLIIAFFRDTAENTPKHLLLETLDLVHQLGPGTGIELAEYHQHVRRTLTDDQKHLNPAPPPSDRITSSGEVATQWTPAVGSDTRSLLHLISQWLTFHLDCSDDAVPALYNILHAARWHSYTPVCRFFDSAVRFDAPAALWFAVGDTIDLFRRTLEASVQDVFSVQESTVQECVKKTFATSLSNAAVTRISVTVHHFFLEAVAAAESQQQQQQMSSNLLLQQPSPEISLRSVFVSGMEFAKRKHRRLVAARATNESTTSNVVWAADSVDESAIVQCIRNECLQAWFDFVAELTESVLDRAIISPEGHVTPHSFVAAVLAVDPLRPKESMDKVVRAIFGKEKPRRTLQQLERQHSLFYPAPPPDPLSIFPSSGGGGVGGSESGSMAASSMMMQRPDSAVHGGGGDGTDALSIASPQSGGTSRSAAVPAGATDATVAGESPGRTNNSNALASAEDYRHRVYEGGDMMLVHDVLARLRNVPVARYTPLQEQSANSE